jgi:acetyl-CoA carboxylase biotin carboxyl carrier protein
MFYASQGPKAPPFVIIGQEIEPGQTVGLIEVMKCFYPLKYQGNRTAKIRDLKVKHGSPVSVGTKLYAITSL